ncbi:hypothetical protein HPB50_012166 [Hyalomma asiaticum]|uniref:Uncharacterized protein n=1 Tax=Hyalomma asiaticum TaxID=266040 RepID=A0ACB7SQC1_HYAAI|nr:hypothetical protein HPB50_012166 [Hyalomma asiaticum]
MAGSQRAATAVAYGRGTSSVSMPKDYRIVLPTVSTGDAMKRAVVLHCDILGRPYRIEDFRKPLQDAGVIRDVAVIGAYQMTVASLGINRQRWSTRVTTYAKRRGQRTRTALTRSTRERNPPESGETRVASRRFQRQRAPNSEAAAEKMDAETAPAKRRHNDVVAVSQSQRLRQIEASVGVGAKKKARSGARVRASSPSRGDVDANF